MKGNIGFPLSHRTDHLLGLSLAPPPGRACGGVNNFSHLVGVRRRPAEAREAKIDHRKMSTKRFDDARGTASEMDDETWAMGIAHDGDLSKNITFQSSIGLYYLHRVRKSHFLRDSALESFLS